MADEKYTVEANLRLNSSGARKASESLGSALEHTSNIASSLTRNLLAIGGAYLGINALVSGVRGAASSMMEFHERLQGSSIALQSIISQVDHISLEAAGKSAAAVYDKLVDIAARTIADTQDLFSIFTGIVGPIRAAGSSMEDVLTITEGVVQAASTLNEPFDEAQRDIALMVQGTAGMDTRLFAILRSMGLVKETTEAWNHQLTQAQRISKIQTVLAGFAASGKLAENSFKGVRSTFVDLFQITRGKFAEPIFQEIANFLGVLNAGLQKNAASLQDYMEQLGNVVSAKLRAVFGWILERGKYVAENWDSVVAKLTGIWESVKSSAATFLKSALAIGVAAKALSLGRMMAPTVGRVAGDISAAKALVAAGGVGGAAAPLGVAEAFSAGAAAAFAPLTEALAALAPVLLPLAAILTAVGGLVIAVVANFDLLSQLFGGMDGTLADLGQLWDTLFELLKAVGSVVMVPLLGMFASFIASVQLILAVLSPVLWIFEQLAKIISNLIRAGLRWLVEVGLPWVSAEFAALMKWMGPVAGVIDSVIDAFKRMWSWFKSALSMIVSETELMANPAKGIAPVGSHGTNVMALETMSPESFTGGPKERQQVVNDFRGSTFNIKQDFRDQDPDRVAMMFQADLVRQSEKRIRSGMMPAFSV